MRTLREQRELLRALVSRELKSRTKGSALGVLWSLLTPLFMAGIYAFFFRLLAGRAANTASIIVGVFAWQFTAVSIQQGMGSVTNNANLVKKVAFPRIMLPLSSTVAAGVDYLISLVVQLGVVGFTLWHTREMWGLEVFALPLVFGIHAVFNLSLALLLGAMNVYFRDTRHLVGVALSAFFFLSPAMYDLGFMETFAAEMDPRVLRIYSLNPLAGLFTAYRWAFLPGSPAPSGPWIWAGMALILPLFLLSLGVFRRAQRNFADFV